MKHCDGCDHVGEDVKSSLMFDLCPRCEVGLRTAHAMYAEARRRHSSVMCPATKTWCSNCFTHCEKAQRVNAAINAAINERDDEIQTMGLCK